LANIEHHVFHYALFFGIFPQKRLALKYYST